MPLPAADEVAPWVVPIIRLWDDAELPSASNAVCRRYAACWSAAELRAAWLGLSGNCWAVRKGVAWLRATVVYGLRGAWAFF